MILQVAVFQGKDSKLEQGVMCGLDLLIFYSLNVKEAMKKTTYLLLLLLPLSSWAVKDVDPKLIDHDWIKISEQLEAETKKRCSEIESSFKRLDCRGEVRVEFKNQGNYRGVENYINKHYQHLDKAGLKTLISEYKALQKIARDDSDLPHSPTPTPAFEPGEINKHMLDVELKALENLLKNKDLKSCANANSTDN